MFLMKISRVWWFLLLSLLFCGPAFAQEQSGPNAHVGNNNVKKDIKEKQSEILYSVVTAKQGGWKPSDVGAPFEVGKTVYCHKTMANCEKQGVDFLSDTKTVACKVEMADSSLIRVKCKGESRLMSANCCEKATSADTSVFATPSNLIHYATWGNTEPVTIATGMKMVEERHEAQLRARYNGVHVPVQLMFLYFADWEWDDKTEKYTIDSNVPLRVEKSTLYHAPFHRTLLRGQTAAISDKWELAQRVHKLGLNFKGSPFLVTYFTLLEALEAVEDPSAAFLLKPISYSYGSGVNIESSEVLNALWERKAKLGLKFVVQEIVTDLALLVDHEFDIKFYILTHAGRLYLHMNAEVVLEPREALNNSTDGANKKIKEGVECINTFLSSRSTGEERRWLDGIHAGLVASLPVMEPILRATAAEDGGFLYHIFAGRAIVRQNGEIIFVSFTDWPVVDWTDTGYENPVCDATTSSLTPQEKKEAYESTLSEMFADFYSIVLGLANTTSVTDDSESDLLLDGRIREVIGFQNPSLSGAKKILPRV